MTRPTIRKGDYGTLVRQVQHVLQAMPVDGDFGPVTVDAVERFQAASRISVDGVVGPDTWTALEDAYRFPAYPAPPLEPLEADVALRIEAAALASDVAGYYWEDRGVAPTGYVHGMALAYSTALRKLNRGLGSAREMARAETGQESTDALAWYSEAFAELGMDNSQPGRNTLRHLFVMLMGLGMRESSGRHCEGRDMSAENTSSDTAEAGLFQASWNFHACCVDIEDLFNEYSRRPPVCALEVFRREVECSDDDWSCYGSGAGAEFQSLCKECPQFAVESTAVGLRNLRQHWGPINRFEVEILDEANMLFRDVETILLEAKAIA